MIRQATESSLSMLTTLLERYECDPPVPSKTLQRVCKHTCTFLDAPTPADEALHYRLGKLVALANEVDRN